MDLKFCLDFYRFSFLTTRTFVFYFFFFLNDPAPPEIYPLSLPDALPIPAGTLTVTWSKFSGPGTVTFGNVNALSTTASFSSAGTYVLRLTATDSELSSSADVTIIVTPLPSPHPSAPVTSTQLTTPPASAN